MIDELYLAPTPVCEPCAQLGQPDYFAQTRRETRAFLDQLLRHFGEPPAGAWFKVRRCHHEFGTYHDIVVRFDDQVEEAVEFAYRAEDELPLYWDDIARKELGLPPADPTLSTTPQTH
jgi:hypothetical protein